MCVDPVLPHESLAQAFAKVLEVSIAGEISKSQLHTFLALTKSASLQGVSFCKIQADTA